ncbi:MAG: hypothetical protein Ct9H300mP28_36690 [Pseudomonadota bacterium]|nr:MAG: hypothetical protein Ct9H300mP28_36690 [Pseudomonadota bacterium]
MLNEISTEGRSQGFLAVHNQKDFELKWTPFQKGSGTFIKHF